MLFNWILSVSLSVPVRLHRPVSDTKGNSRRLWWTRTHTGKTPSQPNLQQKTPGKIHNKNTVLQRYEPELRFDPISQSEKQSHDLTLCEAWWW